MRNSQFDAIIVGSGPAGVSAAYPLVKAGLKVAILDGGLDSEKQDKKIDDFPNINFNETSNAYALIKKSSFVFNKTYNLLKLKSNVEIIQSLAKGGLSVQWHGIWDNFSDNELKEVGLPANEVRKEYQEVAKFINSKSLIHTNSKSEVYCVSRFPFNTGVAIEKLKKFKNFTYIPNQLVSTVNDNNDAVEVKSISIDKSIPQILRAKYLILAAGSINTTRILLRSLNLFNYKTTFLTKAHFLTACVSLKKNVRTDATIKSDQMVISSKDTLHGVGTFFVQLYKLNPLAVHKVLQYIPLPKFAAYPLLYLFYPLIMVADIRFPSFESKDKFIRLIKGRDKKDILEISFKESLDEKRDHKLEFSKVAKNLRSLGLFPLKTTSDYSTSHYAGGVPYQKGGKLSVDINGKLNQKDRIYVADSSIWRALPAKAPTFTIMANASRVAKKVLKNFNKDDKILK